jgi:peptidoglycan/LPS O-acetylase OafA/YrhL
MEPRARLLKNLQRKNIPGLDGIRGLAALSVVAAHGWSDRFPSRFAVQIFFVISGLLITWLLLQERQRYGEINRKAFYCRRAFRLFPALFALLAWEHFTRLPHTTRGGMIATAFYFANYYGIFGGQLLGLGQTWSLAVEEHFYLIWPQFFTFVRNRRALLKGCFAVAGIQTVWRLIAGHHGSYIYAELATETASSAALIGCGLALLLWDSPKRLPALALKPFMAPISLGAILALAQLPRFPQLYWGVPLGIPFAAIIVLQAITYEWSFLENPVARYLGRISYGIYLWSLVATEIAKMFGHGMTIPLMFVIGVALASLSHHLIERPVQTLGRRWLASTTRSAAVPIRASASIAQAGLSSSRDGANVD